MRCLLRLVQARADGVPFHSNGCGGRWVGAGRLIMKVGFSTYSVKGTLTRLWASHWSPARHFVQEFCLLVLRLQVEE